MRAAVRVAAAVLRDASGRVLISQRPEGKQLAGYWEFPGGKIAAGESAEQALARELAEELGVSMKCCHPLLQLRHDYPDCEVELAVYLVDEYAGQPQGLEAQALKWVWPAELEGEALLPADRPIVEELSRIARLWSVADEGNIHATGQRAAGNSAR